MSILDKLERKLGRFAIPHLMRYIIIGNIAAYIMSLINYEYFSYLILDPDLVMKGQVWRLLTFIFIPEGAGGTNILMVAISLYFYYFIGSALEARWGAFRFNVYYLIGILATIATSFIFKGYGTPSYINESLFLAFATLFPELQVMLFFIIPIKVKWLGILSGGLLILQFITSNSLSSRAFIIVAMLNYILFFGPQLVAKIKAARRRQKFTQAVNSSRSPYTSPSKGKVINDVPFHKCHVCGKTELDDPNMQFRYCSKCNGNFEYCMDHINTHEHVK
ncbi:MAG: rhomboid family intramembrane serine protease [Clostridia bacterium]|nr:rhomboid family intramembrane serine protease [Bianquea renquensis]